MSTSMESLIARVIDSRETSGSAASKEAPDRAVAGGDWCKRVELELKGLSDRLVRVEQMLGIPRQR